MTTEHFTLQTARAVVNAEISARLQLYMTTLSSAIIALALVAQVSGALGRAFQAFALVLLPVVYFLGLVTLARLLQAAAEWRTYGQARCCRRSPGRPGSWSAWPSSAPTPSGSSAATWTPPRWPFRPRPNGSPDRPVSDRQKPAGSLVERDSR